ncbi:hypothetical protein GUK36_40160, partial [Rhizobium leguminosarum]
DLRTQSQDEGVRRRAFAKVRTKLGQLRADQQQSIAKLSTEKPRIEASLGLLDQRLVTLWRSIIIADQEFREEVAKKAACGKFINTLAVAATIVATASTGGVGAIGAYAGLLKLWRDLGHNEKDDAEYPDWVKSTLSDSDRRIKLIEKVEGDSKKVAEALARFKDLMGIT